MSPNLQGFQIYGLTAKSPFWIAYTAGPQLKSQNKKTLKEISVAMPRCYDSFKMQMSVFDSPNSKISFLFVSSILRISSILLFPQTKCTIFGGQPSSWLRSSKSLSFVSIVKPFSFANLQIVRSSAAIPFVSLTLYQQKMQIRA